MLTWLQCRQYRTIFDFLCQCDTLATTLLLRVSSAVACSSFTSTPARPWFAALPQARAADVLFLSRGPPVILAWLLVGCQWLAFPRTSRLLLPPVVRLTHCLDFLARATGSSFDSARVRFVCAQSPLPLALNSPTPRAVVSGCPLTHPLLLRVLCRTSATFRVSAA